MGRLMAGEATTKCGPTTSEQKSIRHPPLLQSQHPIKTDEIEVIETTVGGDERPQDAKVSTYADLFNILLPFRCVLAYTHICIKSRPVC